MPANMYSIRKIDLIGIFFLCLMDDYGLGDQFAEVVHGKLGKYFGSIINVGVR